MPWWWWPAWESWFWRERLAGMILVCVWGTGWGCGGGSGGNCVVRVNVELLRCLERKSWRKVKVLAKLVDLLGHVKVSFVECVLYRRRRQVGFFSVGMNKKSRDEYTHSTVYNTVLNIQTDIHESGPQYPDPPHGHQKMSRGHGSHLPT